MDTQPDPAYLPVATRLFRKRLSWWVTQVAYRGKQLLLMRGKTPVARVIAAPDASDPIDGTLCRAGEIQAATNAAATASQENSEQKHRENSEKTAPRPIPAARRTPKRGRKP